MTDCHPTQRTIKVPDDAVDAAAAEYITELHECGWELDDNAYRFADKLAVRMLTAAAPHITAQEYERIVGIICDVWDELPSHSLEWLLARIEPTP